MSLVHILGNSSYVGRSESGGLAAVSKKNGAWRDEFFGSLKFGLETKGGSL